MLYGKRQANSRQRRTIHTTRDEKAAIKPVHSGVVKHDVLLALCVAFDVAEAVTAAETAAAVADLGRKAPGSCRCCGRRSC